MLALACLWQLGLLSVQSEVLAEVQSESPGIAGDQVPVLSSLVMQKMNLHPLAFTENQGQWGDRVLFRANAGGATMWFTKDGAYYQFTRRIFSRSKPLGFDNSMNKRVETARVSTYPKEAGGPPFMVGIADAASDRFDHEQDSIESIMIKASFVGANPDPQMNKEVLASAVTVHTEVV